jgi:tetratricopeptide (TPR) repeat protein
MALVLVVAGVLIVLISQRDDKKSADQSATTPISAPTAPQADVELKPADLSESTRNTPKILESMGSNADSDRVTAPGLDSLIAGLEAKVKADPKNVGNRVLLAQTYNELGMRDKAVTELRALHKQEPENLRVDMVLASLLSQSSEPADIQDSLDLLDRLAKSTDPSIKQYLVSMYKGDALIRKQDHKGAMENWKSALQGMPAGDNRRTVLEQRIGNLNAAPGIQPPAKASDSADGG